MQTRILFQRYLCTNLYRITNYLHVFPIMSYAKTKRPASLLLYLLECHTYICTRLLVTSSEMNSLVSLVNEHFNEFRVGTKLSNKTAPINSYKLTIFINSA
jgi:hypothetical protein